ncbi:MULTISPECIES: PAS domain S-box protein [Planktothrix]|uniref:Circadian input-output histidine kinase CikA n=2 Tax=Planktothrix rubescens CCAP 1459/22 TaxID=329571 RepID=A0A6J7ZU07_PLARU|nr:MULTISPECIES: PAS domain S-box protein [Planktothrix]CAC5345408.1 Cyanobacterial phytochrome B (modular protein) [Planktothrix rubescens NIVA-CYA 18]CAD5959369.1 Cyanobacterial phytochrome B [Planktothrix rubescens NIVA-CYA 18]
MEKTEKDYLALQESDEKFRLAFDKANIGMCLVDLQGNLFQVNEKISEIFGYSQDELKGLNVSDLAIAEDKQISQKFIHGAVVAHDDSGRLEKRYRHRLGHIIYGEVSSSLVRDTEGNPLYFISQVQDISERKRYEIDLEEARNALAKANAELEERVSVRTAELQKSETALRQSEMQFRRYFEQNLIGMAMTSPSKAWINVNDKLCEILGYSFAELQELSWDKITHPEDLAIDLEKFNLVIDGQIEGYEIDKRFIHKTGQIVYTSLAVQCHRKPNGKLDFFIALIQDISDRKKAEIALQESQDFLQKVTDTSPNIIYIYDLQQQCNIYVNREIATILGYSPIEIQAMGANFFSTLMHPDDLQNMPAEYARLARALDGEIYDCEYRMRNTQGEWRWLYSRHSVFSRDLKGQVKCTVGSAQDITERKLAETQLQQTYAELLQATRLKDEFLATMSHELRTPLNAILGMTELLQEEIYGSINEEQMTALQTIENSGSHLLELINDVLDVAKIESGQVHLEISSISIAALCESSLLFIQQQARKKNIQVHRVLPSNLPNIHVDERRIRQALINLLNNAVKFTLEGGTITLEVSEVRLESSTTNLTPINYLKIAVIDTGIGISSENIPKLFQPFIQIDSALNRKYDGMGLGLALVKRLVELHGGTVELTSELGVGSCFAINLPINFGDPSIEDQTNSDLSEQDQIGQSQTEGLISPLILLAEDNEANIMNINTVNDLELVTLTNCDREPIHIPRSIQPHGLLMVLSETDLSIVQVSANSLDILGVEPLDLLDRPLADFIGSDRITDIANCLERDFENINPLSISFVRAGSDTLDFKGIVHRAISGEIVLELEPILDNSNKDFFHFYHQIKNTLSKIQATSDLSKLCNVIVQEISEITGFDRVMIYRFNEGGDGNIIAEIKQPEQKAFLGLRYPDSDIPKQAKHLYTLNWLRLIPDMDYQPCQLVTSPTANPEVEIQPLDMSYCGLRSISPLHIEYLKNMEVAASLTISLIQQQKLWGLIACHHNSPKFIPYEVRTVCEFLGQLMSTELANKEANENLDYKLQLKNIQSQFVERLSKANDFVKELTADPEALLKLTGAAGAAICDNEEITLLGKTPQLDQLKLLLTWIPPQFDQDIFVTDALSHLYPEAVAYKDVAGGLLAMAISKIQQRYVIWFRPEIAQTVTWAGNPEKPKRIEEDGSVTIFPRQSFEAWQEIVDGRSLTWLDCEVAGARELRQAIVDIVLRQAEDIALINVELERSNSELDAFAYIASHDLKEPLRGIHNYATFLLEDYSELLQGDGADKLNTLVRLTKRMESLIESLLKFSRLGRQELQMSPIALDHLLENVTELFGMNPQWENCQIRMPQSLPTVLGDRILLEEVFTNLISNAFKYNDQSEKWAEIGWIETNAQNPDFVTISVHDNGIGIREKHLDSVFRIFKRLHSPNKYGGGTGAGLTIVKKIIERHGGTIQVQSIYGQGTTFLFTLPIKVNISSLETV